MSQPGFKHMVSVRVRFNEVDMLGVCNNAVYINYFEDARLQYIKNLGLVPKNGLFTDGRLFFIVRNEVNYRAFAKYDEELNVYTKISFIKNSSFGFEHVIANAETGSVIVEGSGVIVQVDPKSRKSTPLPVDFIEKIKEFEPGVKIITE